jgi:hypothetical protein
VHGPLDKKFQGRIRGSSKTSGLDMEQRAQ